MSKHITRFQWFINQSGETQARIGDRLKLSQSQVSKLARGRDFPGRATNNLMKKMSGGVLHAGNCHDLVDAETGEPIAPDSKLSEQAIKKVTT